MTSLVIAGAAGGGAYWLFTRSDELLKAELLRQLAQMFPNAEIDLDRAHYDLAGKVRAHLVKMTLPEETSPALTISELVITLDREQFAESQAIVIHTVRLVKPRAWVTRFVDQTWNWQQIRMQRTEGGVLPDLEIEGGIVTIQLEQPENRPAVPVQCTDIQLTALATSERSWSVTAASRVDNSALVQVRGEGTLDRFPWKLSVKADGLMIDQNLIAKVLKIRPDWRHFLDQAEARLEKFAAGSLSPTRPGVNNEVSERGTPSLGQIGPDGIVNLGVQLLTDVTVHAGQTSASSPPDFQLEAVFQNGRIANALLPLPLNDVTGRLAADRAHVSLHELSGRHGESLIQCSAAWSTESQPVLHVHGRKIVVDESLAARLPGSLQRLVRSMNLAGICNFDAEVVRTDSGYLPKIDLALSRGNLTYEKFRYPIRDVAGTLAWRGDLAILEAKGHAGTAPVTITGTIKHPGAGAEMVLLVQAKDLPIDSTLLEVSPPVVSKTIAALNLQGSGDVWTKLIKPAGVGMKWTTDIAARLHDCSLKYERFPIRIDRVGGLVRWDGETAVLEDLSGRHADSKITCSGTYRRSPDPGKLELNLTASDAPLDAELHAALPLRLQQAWQEFRPTGRFDLESNITWSPGSPVDVRLPSVTLKHAEVALKSFPFPWYNVAGTFRFADDKLTVLSLSAEHDDCRLRGEGSGNFAADSPWQFRFTEFFVDDLPTTPALRRALPPELRLVMDTMNPSGTISLQGPITFNGPDDRRDDVGITWKTDVVLSGSDLTLGVPVENLHGRVSIHGAWDGREAVITHGALDLDSLEVFGHQLMHVQGPFRYQQGVLTAGSRQAVLGPLDQAGKNARWDDQISAKAIDGTLTLNGIVNFENEPSYRLRMFLTGGNLEQYAQMYLQGQSDIRGNMNGWMELRGQGTNAERMTGAGRLTISPAELYELPVFVQIFNVLGPQLRDRSAFKFADFQFTVANGRYEFRPIELAGQTIRLIGRGSVRFDGVINLEFYSRSARSSVRIPVISNVVDMMSRGWVGVNVTGHIKDPDVVMRTIPELDDALRQFLSGFEPRLVPTRTGQGLPADRR